MRRSRLGVLVCFVTSCLCPVWAQQDESYGKLLTPQVRSDKLGAPQQLRNHVVDGKLRLSLRDAVVLTLENNSTVRVQETQVESSKFSLLGAHAPFDPIVTSSYNVNDTSIQATSQLQGTGGLNFNFNSTSQFAQFNYSQTFESGTNFQGGINSSDNFTNNFLYFLNPYIQSTLTFQVTQPLLRNGWLFPNQAPLIIARRNLQQSRANFEAQVNNNILQAVSQYWAVVEALGNLAVAQSSMAAAEATYRRDKRALELGALPPLDIYRSESQVAQRRVQVIQGEYVVKQAENSLRMTIGADQDPYFEALDLELTEKPEPEGELRTIDAATALQQALARRPEFDASRAALANDDTRIRLAHNHLLPELDLLGTYSSNGVGGTQFTVSGQKLTSSSINQLFGFGFPTYVAQLSLSFPIKNRSAKAEMGNALVSRRADLYNERLLREQVLLDVSNAVHQLEQAKLTIVAGKEALDLANKTMAAEQRKYDLGSSTIFLVLEAQTEVAAAQQTLLQAEVGYQLALATVEHATGELLEPYHVRIAELSR
jgi:outer membrane protein TolC